MKGSVSSSEGRVIDARGNGIPDVPVSNGERVALTDREGRFRLGTDPQRHTHVFITIPPGFSSTDGFCRSIDQWRDGDRVFRLGRRPGRRTSVRFAAVTDLHYGHLPPAGPGATRRVRRDLDRIVDAVPQSQFIVVTGDLTESGVLADLQTMRRLFERTARPVFPVFGNHDGVPKNARDGVPKPWARNYLEAIGPLWYSFEWGRFHFTVDVNMHLWLDAPMIEAKRRWLSADLRLAARRGLDRIVLAHFPPTMRHARALARQGVRLFLCGHFHCLRTYRLGPMRVLGFPSMMGGGIDMMPRGFLDVRARPDCDPDYEYRPLAPCFEQPARIARAGKVWSRELSAYFHRAGPVAADDGRLYVTTSDDQRGGGGSICCLNADSGRTRWSVPTDSAIRNTVAVSDGRVFAVTHTGTVMCVGAQTGRRRWTRRLVQAPDRWINTPPVIAGDLVIAGHDRGGIEAFRVSDGRRRWHVHADRPPFVNSAGDVWPCYRTPVVRDDRVVIACQGREILCVDARTGETCWSHPYPYPWHTPGLVAFQDSVWVPNAQSGEPLLRIEIATGTVVSRARGIGTPVSWSVHDESLYLVVLDRWIGGKGWLQCRSAASGRLRWKRVLGRDPTHAYAYYTEDGPNCQAPPVVQDGLLVVACTDGQLRLFDPATGRGRGEINLGDPAYTAPVFREDRYWIALWSGNLVCRSWPSR